MQVFMVKRFNPYYLILPLLFVVLIAVEYSAPKPVDWRRTYARDKKSPFGCNAFYRLMNEDVWKGKMEEKKQTPFNVLLKSHENKSAYVFINGHLSFSRLDAQYLMEFVSKGNDVFMAASSFYDNHIADTFHIRTDHYYPEYSAFFDSTKKYTVNFCSAALKEKKPYDYKMGFDAAAFQAYDTTRVTVLAVGEDTNAVFLKAPFGKGNFYFLSIPDVFTNYFVVNDPARAFAYKALSFVEADQIWWDEYFKGSGAKSSSPLQFIFANDSLYSGYLLTLGALIIFMIFAMKRRQRPIAIVEPLANNTLQFVEVVGSVYYNSHNHKIIAEEKINSLFEFLRAKFFVSSRKADEETLLRISKLSTIPLPEIKDLFLKIGMVWRQASITEQELIELNTAIENFYKQNKR
jgi:hypothetical protein